MFKRVDLILRRSYLRIGFGRRLEERLITSGCGTLWSGRSCQAVAGEIIRISSRKIERKLRNLLRETPVVIQKEHVCWICCELLFDREVAIPIDALIQIRDYLLRIRQTGRRGGSLSAQCNRDCKRGKKRDAEASNANLPSFENYKFWRSADRTSAALHA